MRCLRACALLLAALGGACLASGCGSSSPTAAAAAGGTAAAGSSSSASPAAVTNTARNGIATASTVAGSPAKTSPSCPAASAVTAAMGAAYQAPQMVSGAGGAMCTYDGISMSNGNDVTFTISSGITASNLKALAKDQSGVSSVSAVSGLGDDAYMDVGSSGLSSELFVQQGTEGVEVSAVGTTAQLESLARAVLAS
jgi:hypothetical protein